MARACASCFGLFRALAFVLAFMLTPGSSEVLESATHLIANGHLAHALDDEEHEPHGEEHGCTGVMHSCACHARTAVALFDADVPGLGSAQRWLSVNVSVGHRPAQGHLVRLDRPPTV